MKHQVVVLIFMVLGGFASSAQYLRFLRRLTEEPSWGRWVGAAAGLTL